MARERTLRLDARGHRPPCRGPICVKWPVWIEWCDASRRVNLAVRRTPKPHVTITYLEPDFTELFRKGLRGPAPDGSQDTGFHGREPARRFGDRGPRAGHRGEAAGVHLPAALVDPRTAAGADCCPPSRPGAGGDHPGQEVPPDVDLLRPTGQAARLPGAGPGRHDGGFGLAAAPAVGRAVDGDRAGRPGGLNNGGRRLWESLTQAGRRRLVAPEGGSCLVNGGGPFTATKNSASSARRPWPGSPPSTRRSPGSAGRPQGQAA